MVRAFFVFVVAFLTGCAAELEPVRCDSYRVDATVSPELRAGVEAGVARWNAFAPASPVTLEPSGACVVRSVLSSSDEYKDRAAKVGGDFQALHVGSSGDLLLVPGNLTCGEDSAAPSVDCVAFAVAHELGHAHGMAHVESPDAVMSASGLRVDEWSEADRAEMLRVTSR